MKILKIPVPEETYEVLRRTAFENHLAMAAVVRSYIHAGQFAEKASSKIGVVAPSGYLTEAEVAKMDFGAEEHYAKPHQSKHQKTAPPVKTMRDVIKDVNG